MASKWEMQSCRKLNFDTPSPNVLYYECNYCSTTIPPDTKGVFTSCKCGKMSIEGTYLYTRVVGDMQYITVAKEIPSKLYVYRIKQVRTGLFFVPRRGCAPAHFSEKGKFYSKHPSLAWIDPSYGECIVEKYSIKKEI